MARRITTGFNWHVVLVNPDGREFPMWTAYSRDSARAYVKGWGQIAPGRKLVIKKGEPWVHE